MGHEPRYPVMIDLADRPCLVVGAGRVAARKVRGLLAAGARVQVVAPEVGGEVDQLVGAGEVTLHQRPVADDDVLGPDGEDGPRWAFVIAATDDRDRNRQVVQAATRVGVWANDATDPRGGPASLPAVHRDDPITVAVATGGAQPGAAAWLRDRVATAVAPEVAVALDLLDRRRRDQPDGPRVDWRTIIESGMLDAIREGRVAEAKERLEACLSSSSD